MKVREQVKLSEIRPNPFRQLNTYPLDTRKIEKLCSSIKRTEFWENVVARKKAGHYELAYGHHRIEAARQELGATAKVRLIVKDLDDAAMLRIMAADNDEVYSVTPGFILEVVSATKSFISIRYNSPALGGAKTCKSGETTLCHRIHTQIDWPVHRVEDALAQLNAIEEGGLSRKAIESLPSQHAAATLHREVQRAKTLGKPFPTQRQVVIANLGTTENKQSATKIIQQEVTAHIHPKQTSARTNDKDFEDFIGTVANHAKSFSRELEILIQYKSDLNSEIYQNTLAATFLRIILKNIRNKLADLESESPASK